MAQYEASEALKEKLGKAESMEDVVRAFSEEGIEVSAEQLEAMLNEATSADGEISEEVLDHVSGGTKFFPWWKHLPRPFPFPMPRPFPPRRPGLPRRPF